MRLYLVNPANPAVSLTNIHWNRLNRYRVWKPLGLLVLAALTPPDWEVTLIDENLGHPNYERLPKPDLVGINGIHFPGSAGLRSRRNLPCDGSARGDRRHSCHLLPG